VHVQGVDLCWDKERHPGGLLTGPDLATGDPAGETDRELLTDLAVVIGKDMPWVRVDPDDVLGLDLKPGLLAHLARDGLRDALSNVHNAARQRPEGIVATPVQKDSALVVDYDGGRPGH